MRRLTPIKLIVGLGNPRLAYGLTRHNAGSWFALAIAKHYQVSFSLKNKLHGELAQLDSDTLTFKVLLPSSFMNHSGLATQASANFYKIRPDEILVVHDELDLAVGCVKLKTGGGHGGHNGLRDIITQLGSGDFHRLRIGIGHPGCKELVLNYVLAPPTSPQKELMLAAIDRAVTIIPLGLAGDIAAAMCKLNDNKIILDIKN